MIAILDYGMGNLRSVQKAFEQVGQSAEVVSEASGVAAADRLVLPGVGNFSDGMRHLQERDLVEPVRAFAASGRAMLGVCLGMQLMLDSSTEDAPAGEAIDGLGLVSGRCVRFEEDQGPGRARLKVPHMGWNTLAFTSNGEALGAGLEAGSHAYFVHGYVCEPDESADVAAMTRYGRDFCSAIHRGNLWATQFHPEKSQAVGLRILRNFAEWSA